MRNYFRFLSTRINRKLSKQDIRGYKIIIGQITNPNSVLLADPVIGEYIIQNKKTHYDLIVTPSRVFLVNSKDIVDLEVCEEVRNKAISKILNLIHKDRQKLKQSILGRKSNILDIVLSNIRK